MPAGVLADQVGAGQDVPPVLDVPDRRFSQLGAFPGPHVLLLAGEITRKCPQHHVASPDVLCVVGNGDGGCNLHIGTYERERRTNRTKGAMSTERVTSGGERRG
ncbi:hypothetical protein GCM10010532_054430 [Dactylosporangium siamense]|uniref:Uncharacterized protein n=1 Tax=Dactylosporangium siamense TaxID=685454 RepID=A0A919UBV7_9ACTN|nr:hypothetical protein Dsi01nite_041020 [Dactylosporangium siamense]